MKKRNFLVLAVAALLFTSCVSTNSYMSGLQRLSDDANQYGANYTVRDWERSNAHFARYVKKYPSYAKRMTSQERIDAVRMGTTYMKAAVKNGGQTVASELKGIIGSGTDLIDTFKGLFNLKSLDNSDNQD